MFLSETATSDFTLAAPDPDFAEATAAAEKIMRDDREILAVLAR